MSVTRKWHKNTQYWPFSAFQASAIKQNFLLQTIILFMLRQKGQILCLFLPTGDKTDLFSCQEPMRMPIFAGENKLHYGKLKTIHSGMRQCYTLQNGTIHSNCWAAVVDRFEKRKQCQGRIYVSSREDISQTKVMPIASFSTMPNSVKPWQFLDSCAGRIAFRQVKSDC